LSSCAPNHVSLVLSLAALVTSTLLAPLLSPERQSNNWRAGQAARVHVIGASKTSSLFSLLVYLGCHLTMLDAFTTTISRDNAGTIRIYIYKKKQLRRTLLYKEE
jgi:hypothetical protein